MLRPTHLFFIWVVLCPSLASCAQTPASAEDRIFATTPAKGSGGAAQVHSADAGSVAGPTAPTSDAAPNANAPANGSPAGVDPALPCIAPLVAERCALSGCHDATTKSHGMNLSTGSSIYASWVAQDGVDHCTNQVVPRVVPGDPDASLVMKKLLQVESCELGTSMPPPPLEALPPEAVDTIRQWIALGAREDCGSASPQGVGGAGGTPSTSNAGSAGEGPRDVPILPACTSDDPCVGGECLGAGCGDEPWECFLHHACDVEIVEMCSCDGVTFMASRNCPDRSVDHAGACGDGVSCYRNAAQCEETAPTCKAGELPSVVDACWGQCVPYNECRCFYDWDCPQPYACLYEQQRCGLRPAASDAGVIDAGMRDVSDGGDAASP